MSETIPYDKANNEKIDYEAEFDKYLKLIDEIHKRIAEDQDETERLRNETWEIINRLKAA